MNQWQLENPFQEVCIRPVSGSPFRGESPDKRGDDEQIFAGRPWESPEPAQVRTTTPQEEQVQRRFAWGDGPLERKRMLTGSTTSSTPRRVPEPEAQSDGKSTVCRSKAHLFSLVHDTLPTGPVTLEMIVDRRERPSSIPCTKRTPRPAPDFRQTEDWRRAKEAQLRRGLQASEKKLEQRPGLRPLSRRRQADAEDRQMHKSCSAVPLNAEGASNLQAIIANIKSTAPDDELKNAHCAPPRRVATPATATPTATLNAKHHDVSFSPGSPVFGSRCLDPDLLVPWPHEMDFRSDTRQVQDFPPWPHET